MSAVTVIGIAALGSISFIPPVSTTGMPQSASAAPSGAFIYQYTPKGGTEQRTERIQNPEIRRCYSLPDGEGRANYYNETLQRLWVYEAGNCSGKAASWEPLHSATNQKPGWSFRVQGVDGPIVAEAPWQKEYRCLGVDIFKKTEPAVASYQCDPQAAYPKAEEWKSSPSSVPGYWRIRNGHWSDQQEEGCMTAQVHSSAIHIRRCDLHDSAQAWTYDATTAEFRNYSLGPDKCLSYPGVMEPCSGKAEQRWKLPTHGTT